MRIYLKKMAVLLTCVLATCLCASAFAASGGEKKLEMIDLTLQRQDEQAQQKQGWYWDGGSKTLTLRNVNVETVGCCILLPEGNVTIVVSGENELTAKGSSEDTITCINGVTKNTNIMLTGNGSLKLNYSNGGGGCAAGIAAKQLTVGMFGGEIQCFGKGGSAKDSILCGLMTTGGMLLREGSVAAQNVADKGSSVGVFSINETYTQESKADVKLVSKAKNGEAYGISGENVTINGKVNASLSGSSLCQGIYSEHSITLGKNSAISIKANSTANEAYGMHAFDGEVKVNGSFKASVNGNATAGIAANEGLVSLTGAKAELECGSRSKSKDNGKAFGILAKAGLALKNSSVKATTQSVNDRLLAFAVEGKIKAEGSTIIASGKSSKVGVAIVSIENNRSAAGIELVKSKVSAVGSAQAFYSEGLISLNGCKISKGGRVTKANVGTSTVHTIAAKNVGAGKTPLVLTSAAKEVTIK